MSWNILHLKFQQFKRTLIEPKVQEKVEPAVPRNDKPAVPENVERAGAPNEEALVRRTYEDLFIEEVRNLRTSKRAKNAKQISR